MDSKINFLNYSSTPHYIEDNVGVLRELVSHFNNLEPEL